MLSDSVTTQVFDGGFAALFNSSGVLRPSDICPGSKDQLRWHAVQSNAFSRDEVSNDGDYSFQRINVLFFQ